MNAYIFTSHYKALMLFKQRKLKYRVLPLETNRLGGWKIAYHSAKQNQEFRERDGLRRMA